MCEACLEDENGRDLVPNRRPPIVSITDMKVNGPTRFPSSTRDAYVIYERPSVESHRDPPTLPPWLADMTQSVPLGNAARRGLDVQVREI
jgi:hypothetical protein